MIPSLACLSAEILLSLNRFTLCFVPEQRKHKFPGVFSVYKYEQLITKGKSETVQK